MVWACLVREAPGGLRAAHPQRAPGRTVSRSPARGSRCTRPPPRATWTAWASAQILRGGAGCGKWAVHLSAATPAGIMRGAHATARLAGLRLTSERVRPRRARLAARRALFGLLVCAQQAQAVAHHALLPIGVVHCRVFERVVCVCVCVCACGSGGAWVECLVASPTASKQGSQRAALVARASRSGRRPHPSACASAPAPASRAASLAAGAGARQTRPPRRRRSAQGKPPPRGCRPGPGGRVYKGAAGAAVGKGGWSGRSVSGPRCWKVPTRLL